MPVGKILLAVILIFTSCVSKKEEGPVVSDATLYQEAQNVSSFSYFENSPDTLATDPGSPHFAFVRIRFNPRARSAMNDSLNKLTATEFPDESMIVKEVYSFRGGPPDSYEIMYKIHGAANGNSGWVWSELASDGSAIYSAVNKGEQCAGCHSLQINSDLVRTFSLH